MENYLLQITIYWAAFYLLYYFFLRKDTFFHFNRFYLLGTFLLGLCLPFIEVSNYIPAENPFEVWLPVVQILPEGEVLLAETKDATHFNWVAMVWWIYLLGIGFAGIRFLLGIFKINQLKKSGEPTEISGIEVIKTNKIETPFSFFGNLFWSEKLDSLNHAEQQQILLHESAHIRQRHSFDVMIFEMASILLWWNPLVYAFKHSIREVHEFLADDYVIRQTNKQQYGRMLLGQSKAFSRLINGNSLALANHFFHSQLKNRIMMMTKEKSNKLAMLKYFLLLPLVTVLVFACEKTAENEFSDYEKNMVKEAAAENDLGEEFVIDTIITFDPETYEETIQVVKSNVLRVAEVMPRFPGCEDESGGIDAIEKCAQKKLLEHIYSNIKYPKAAREAGIEGTSVVSFVVSNYGNVFNAKVLRSIHSDCDAEILRIVEEMPPWIPGEQDGQKVNVRFNLPVRFKLSGSSAVISSDNLSKPKDE